MGGTGRDAVLRRTRGRIAGGVVLLGVFAAASALLVRWALGPAHGGPTSYQSLRPGDCTATAELAAGDSRLDVVPCSTPHAGQVMALVDAGKSFTAFPGYYAAYFLVTQACEFDVSYGIGYGVDWHAARARLRVSAIPPVQATWGAEHGRTGICLTVATDGKPLTRSYFAG